ncbi:MAG: orotate phosphoribosyltransferase [Candidatus Bathyarchaeia archaeon]|jgi:orotate phosphoribosyltransferase
MVGTGLDEFCNILLRTGSLKFGTFKLTSGLLSPYYVDLRLIPSYPEAFQQTINMYRSVIEPDLVKRVQRLAGVPTAGIAYAAVIALNLNKPLLYVRKEQKEHGREKKVEGLLQPGDRVLILDDVVTTGKSLLEAAEAIRAEGGIVDDAVVLLDRQQGAGENLQKKRMKLHTFTTMRRIADKLLNLGTIDERQHKEILGQIIS